MKRLSTKVIPAHAGIKARVPAFPPKADPPRAGAGTILRTVVVFFTLVVISTAPARCGETEDLVLISKAFNDGFYESARDYASSFLQKYPASSEIHKARFILGNAQFELESCQEAVPLFQAIAADEKAGPYRDRSLYMIGECYVKNGQPELAAKFYEELLRDYPASVLAPDAEYASSLILLARGNRAGAAEGLEALAAEHPGHRIAQNALFELGQISFEDQRYSQTVGFLKGFLDKNPVHARAGEAQYLLGESYRHMGDYPLALESFKKVLNAGTKGPFYAVVLHGIAWTYFQMGRYEESLQAFTPFIAEVKGSPIEDSFLFGRARALHKLKNYPEALKAYETVVQNFPKSPLHDDALLWASEIYLDQQDYAAARSRLDRLLSEHPLSELADEAKYNVAWTHLRMGEDAKAILLLQEISYETNDEFMKVRVLCGIGDAYLENDKIEEAASFFDQVLKNHPKSIYADYAQYQLANCLLKSGKIDAAILGFQSLGVNFPQSAYGDDALYGLGAALMKKGDHAAAAEAFDKLVRMFPESKLRKKAYFQAANSFYNLGRLDEALARFGDIATQGPGDSDLDVLSQYQIGLIHFKEGQDDKAVSVLKELVSRYPDSRISAEVYFILGQHFFDRGQYAEARKELAGIGERFSDHRAAGPAAHLAALSFHRQGDIGQAVAGYREMLERYPNSEAAPGAVAQLTDLLVGAGKPGEAKQELLRLNSAVQAPRASTMLKLKLGGLLKSEGNLREALFYFSEALKTAEEKEAAEIQFRIAETIELEGKRLEASGEFLKVGYMYPNQKEFAEKGMLRAVQILEGEGRTEEAAKLKNKLAQSDGAKT